MQAVGRFLKRLGRWLVLIPILYIAWGWSCLLWNNLLGRTDACFLNIGEMLVMALLWIGIPIGLFLMLIGQVLAPSESKLGRRLFP